VFESLKKYKRIFVTGPHRSGTTICTKMIANDTGFPWFKMDAIGGENLKSLNNWLVKRSNNFILQCPTLCYCIHKVGDKNTMIVLLVRNIDDILKSQKRIGWDREKGGLETYGVQEGILAEVKYKFWNEQQKQKIKNYLEVEYESLKDHWLWVPKKYRTNFKPRQTSVNTKYTFDSSSKDAILKEKLRRRGRI